MNRIAIAFSAFCLQFCAVSPFAAQASPASGNAAFPPNDEIPFAPLVAHSRFSINWPEGTMYEGDIVIPVHLWSRTTRIEQLGESEPEFALSDCALGKKVGTLVPRGSRNAMASGCTFTFLPHFTFRQQKGGSAPVVTPTFNPAFELNLFALGLDKDRGARGLLDRDARSLLSDFAWLGMRPRDSDQTGTLGAFHLRAGHYSNGQSGCLYVNQVYDESSDSCAPVVGSPDLLNTVDGSFSTHYLEAGATVAPIAFDSLGVERRMMSLGYGIRHYPGGWISEIGGMSPELAAAYGRWEFAGNAMLRWRSSDSEGMWRRVYTARLEGTCAYKRAKQYQVCRGSLEGMTSFPSLYGFGVSLRWVAGWDPYNIAFGTTAENYYGWMPIVSIIIDHSRAITITRAGRAAEAR